MDYGLDKAFWRHGYAKEAVNAVVAYGVREKGLTRIAALVCPANAASGNRMSPFATRHGASMPT